MVNIHNQEGGVAGTRALDEKLFDAAHKPHLLHEAVRLYMTRQRSGTACTKTRGEVHRTNRKPWRQKGTGRARAGSARSPIWVGGGNTFGPRPRDFGMKMNRRARKQALRTALSLRARAGDLLLLENIAMEAPKTKDMVKIFESLGMAGTKTLLVLGSRDMNILASGRNIPWLDMTLADSLTTYRVLRSDKLVMTVAALERLEERSSA